MRRSVTENSPLSQATPRLRADARVNRSKIIDVAREALLADPDASMNSVAIAAGVGAGTLYRHFATREDLVAAVYESEIDALGSLAAKLLEKHSPLKAFELWCDRVMRFGHLKSGVRALMGPTRAGADYRVVYRPMFVAVELLMDACVKSKELAPGGNVEDFLMLLGMLFRLPDDGQREVRSRRIRALIFRGLGASEAALKDAAK